MEQRNMEFIPHTDYNRMAWQDLKESGVEKTRCFYCRQEGIYGLDIVDTGYRDSTGHDTTVSACKDTFACLKRQWSK